MDQRIGSSFEMIQGLLVYIKVLRMTIVALINFFRISFKPDHTKE